MYNIEYLDMDSLEYIENKDKHISKEMLKKKIIDKEVIAIKESEKVIGWLRYGYFWDSIPFMNLIMIDERYRGQGIGKSIVGFWENEMKDKGYRMVMTSTLSNESAQHFYRKLNYKDVGCLILEEEGVEIVFKKEV